MATIGIIGYGNMGSALCRGLKRRKYAMVVTEKKEERIRALKRHCKLKPISVAELAQKAQIIVLAVKPQELAGLAAELAPHAAGKRFLSVIAGKTISYFENAFNTTQICRCMPNLAAMVGQSAVGVSFHPQAEETFRAECLAIIRAIGYPFPLAEGLLPAFTGLSGSGIAYVFAFLHALALGGTAVGIRYDESLAVATATLRGAVAALGTGKEHPVSLLSKVISPAGTTIQGVKQLEEFGFSNAVIKAVEAAAARASEMEQ
ncbi:MAG TPA: pyrroline-5-carboxylate reductase [Spirochaetia bacterium]|nr:pyrroline-5-carboxylate reductase [Spirochaetia bacterium]